MDHLHAVVRRLKPAETREMADYNSANPELPTSFGEGSYSSSEQQRIQDLLNSRLGKEHLATRAGPGGSKLTYVEGSVAVELANETFGFNGWSSTIMSLNQEICEQDQRGHWHIGVSAIMRIQLRDGAARERSLQFCERKRTP